jgi:membrane-associated phospholipid phosphatase
MGLGYLVYSQVRGLAGSRVSDAFINAYNLIDIERDLGIFKELTIQQWVLANDLLVNVFNLIYFYGFFPLVIPSAIFLFLKRPDVYRLARNAFLISGAIAVCFFLTLPTAPPRLVGMGFIDTLNQSFTPTYSSIPGVNHYAALPSMHVGWTFLLAVALYLAFKTWPLKPVFFAIPIAMFSATVATGNHYFLDGVLGLIVAFMALKVALYVEKRTAEQSPLPQAPNSS